MSIPSLIQGSATNCGPEHPLASLSKTFNRDRSLYQDRFQPDSSSTHTNTSDAARLQYDSNTSEERKFFEVTDCTDINLVRPTHEIRRIPLNEPRFIRHPIPHSNNWSLSFLNSSAPLVQAPNLNKYAQNSKPGGWQEEFLKDHLSHQTKTHTSPNANIVIRQQPKINYENALGMPHMPEMSRIRHSALSTPGQGLISSQVPIDQRHSNEYKNDQTAWDSAFLELDQSLSSLTIGSSIESLGNSEFSNQYQVRSHSPTTSSSLDDIARTAGSLIATVELGQRSGLRPAGVETNLDEVSSDSTIEKFSQSAFMDLMRKLRDGEVKFEGDKTVEQLKPVQLQGSQANSGGVWANDYAQHIAPANTQNLTATPIVVDRSINPGLSDANRWRGLRVPETLAQAKQDYENRLKEMNEFLEQDDLALEAARHRAEMNKFQGDGGGIQSDLDEILQAASEVDRPELKFWQDTRVPGASERWSEQFDDIQEESEEFGFDESGMFGRPLTIQEFEQERIRRSLARPSAQQLEWEKLQADWESHFSQTDHQHFSHDGLSIPHFELAPRIKEIEAQTGYTFQIVNPYVLLDRSTNSMHHSKHDQHQHSSLNSMYPSTLQSVLQKESLVLQTPESATAWLELGIKQQENEREDMAIKALRKAIELDPKLSEAVLALAISYTNENQRADAFEQIENWIHIEMSQVPRYAGVLSCARPDHFLIKETATETQVSNHITNKHDILTETLIEIARLGGRSEGSAIIDADVQIALGVLFNANGEFTKASDCFGAALSVRPEDPVLYNRLGATLANSGKPDQAIELSYHNIKDYPEYKFRLADYKLHLLIKRYYHKALELLPTYIRARYNLSISLINLQRYKASAENLLGALEMQQSESSQMSDRARLTRDAPSTSDATVSGVTSKVLWDTLAVNCSLLGRVDLGECLRSRNLTELKSKLLV